MGETVDALGYKADVPARTKEKLVGAKESVVGTVSGAKDTVMGKVAGTGQRISDTTPSSGDMRQGARQAVGMAQSNPLGLAVGAAAVGFVTGLLLPSTRVENEHIGEMADQVKSTASDVGQEALERGKQVAQETVQTAKETAKEQGQQQGQELAQSAQQQAQETGQTTSASY